MKKLAKRHHFLPRHYLAGFTSDGTDKGDLFVVDKHEVRVFPTTPENIGLERHFNRIEYHGEQSDILEQQIAKIEGVIAPAVKRLCASQEYPKGDDLTKILNLVATVRTHNPKARRENKYYWQSKIEAIGEKIVEVREGRLKEDGLVLDSGEPITEMDIARFNSISTNKIKTKKYKLQFPQNLPVREEFDDMGQLLHLLNERCWSVMISPDNCPGFLCSDDPVSLINEADRKLSSFRNHDTEVFFPVCSRVALLGVYGVPKESVQNCDSQFVGAINFGIMQRADRFVYSKEDSTTLKWRGDVEIVPLTVM